MPLLSEIQDPKDHLIHLNKGGIDLFLAAAAIQASDRYKE